MFSDGVKLDGAVVERSFDRTGPVDVRLTVMDDSGAQCNISTNNAQVLVTHTTQRQCRAGFKRCGRGGA